MKAILGLLLSCVVACGQNLFPPPGSPLMLDSTKLVPAITNSSGGTQVWTNSLGQVQLVSPSTNQVFLGDISNLGSPLVAEQLEAHSTNDAVQNSVYIQRSFHGRAQAVGGLAVYFQGAVTTNGQGTTTWGIQGANAAGGVGIAGSTYFSDAAEGLDGASGSFNDGPTNAAFGTAGYANGNEGLLVGSYGEADAAINGATNVGGLHNVLTEGKSGVFVGHYVEARISPVADGSDDPTFQNALELWDNRESNLPVVVARTNKVQVATLDTNGVWTANKFIGNGLLIHSNTLAVIPTLAKGDVFIGWSSNGVLWSINCNQAGTLTTNKLSP